MKSVIFVAPAILLAACSQVEPEVVVASASPLPATSTSAPTVAPTHTPELRPTDTPQPTATAAPTWEPVALGNIETVLREAGYRRFPFTNDDGVSGFFWVNNNPYERVTTWDDGTIRMEVLHNDAPVDRAERMERHLAVLDTVLPTGFMAELRREHTAYNRSAPTSVTGEPDWISASGDEWQTIWAEYNSSEFGRGGYGVKFSLWWWQSTCPPQYDSCYYSDFPGLDFTGDSSFVFHTILIWLPQEDALPGANA